MKPGGDAAPIHTGIGRCTGSGAIPAPVTWWNSPSNVTVCSVQSRRSKVDLLGRPLAAVAEILTERFVFDGIPADADTETQPAAAEQIDLGRLLGDQRGLSLRQDDDAGDELQLLGHGGEVAVHDERLVKCRVHVVGAIPALVNLRIGADDVVVDENVAETQFLDPLAVRAHSAWISAEFRLRERHANSHPGVLPKVTGPNS